MCAARSITSFTDCSLLVVVVVLFFTGASCSAKLASNLIASGTKSSNNAALDSSRHKRAPGWGKRAPGWGKRQNLNDESYDDFQSFNDISNTGESYRPMEFLSDDSLLTDNTDYDWGKRAPGWGKRVPGWGKRAPGWGKRAPGWGKRAPGWGKRFSEEDPDTSNMASYRDVYVPRWVKRSVDTEEDDFAEMDRRAPGWGKRAPGWGKRAPGWGKRAPGWGKRAPGWGKRNDDIDLETNGAETDATFTAWDDKHTTSEELLEKLDLSQELINKNTALRPEEFLPSEVLSTEKRAPGWGKRAPGWGKRNYLTEITKEDLLEGKRAHRWGKRAPGWGKRAPGWGKRAPGWGKRAPGWGKRAPAWGKRDDETTLEDEISPEEVEDDKRAPGWGKRASTIVKRAASHTTHPSHDVCKELQSAETDFLTRLGELAEQRFFGRGSRDVVNKPSRK
uniref:Apgwamide n=1 Tax=Deroceras reticulatum TaxID=145610 RepID=A0A1X9WED0_DERRE|nr:apgwamide [Deroceras reticulatum]